MTKLRDGFCLAPQDTNGFISNKPYWFEDYGREVKVYRIPSLYETYHPSEFKRNFNVDEETVKTIPFGWEKKKEGSLTITQVGLQKQRNLQPLLTVHEQDPYKAQLVASFLTDALVSYSGTPEGGEALRKLETSF